MRGGGSKQRLFGSLACALWLAACAGGQDGETTALEEAQRDRCVAWGRDGPVSGADGRFFQVSDDLAREVVFWAERDGVRRSSGGCEDGDALRAFEGLTEGYAYLRHLLGPYAFDVAFIDAHVNLGSRARCAKPNAWGWGSGAFGAEVWHVETCDNRASVDMVTHELVHGLFDTFVGRPIPFPFENEQGAFEEAVADVLGELADCRDGSCDWQMCSDCREVEPDCQGAPAQPASAWTGCGTGDCDVVRGMRVYDVYDDGGRRAPRRMRLPLRKNHFEPMHRGSSCVASPSNRWCGVYEMRGALTFAAWLLAYEGEDRAPTAVYAGNPNRGVDVTPICGNGPGDCPELEAPFARTLASGSASYATDMDQAALLLLAHSGLAADDDGALPPDTRQLAAALCAVALPYEAVQTVGPGLPSPGSAEARTARATCDVPPDPATWDANDVVALLASETCCRDGDDDGLVGLVDCCPTLAGPEAQGGCPRDAPPAANRCGRGPTGLVATPP